MVRSRVELMGLEFEAERLVREGVSRADVSRMLGVHPQTLAGWALKGGWRKKDLDLERSGATTRRTILNVAASHAWKRVTDTAQAEQLKLMQEAFLAIADGDGRGAARALEQVKTDLLTASPSLDFRDEYRAEAEAMRAKGIRSLGDAPLPETNGSGIEELDGSIWEDEEDEESDGA